jgi:hypothetical protein
VCWEIASSAICFEQFRTLSLVREHWPSSERKNSKESLPLKVDASPARPSDKLNTSMGSTLLDVDISLGSFKEMTVQETNCDEKKAYSP